MAQKSGSMKEVKKSQAEINGLITQGLVYEPDLRATVYNIDCIACSMCCTIYITYYTLYSIQYTFYGIQHVLYNIYCIVYTGQYTVHITQNVIYSIHYTAYIIKAFQE